MAEELSISLQEGADAESIELVRRIIYDYNRSVGRSDYRPLTVLLRDGVGRVVGGLLGKTEWGWLHIESLAIQEAYRNRGYGTKLLVRAEQEAVERGCHDAFLDTFSFQAPPFYVKRGYEVFGVLENFAGHTRSFLRKRLG
jgi:GNAT superfamily N-acetyltransferase